MTHVRASERGLGDAARAFVVLASCLEAASDAIARAPPIAVRRRCVGARAWPRSAFISALRASSCDRAIASAGFCALTSPPRRVAHASHGA
ncbi:hypothetical protein WT60_28530 [Burkholderia sp. MSMB617WGS]|uniref:Lipoprotein n=1 Tax=Burkholderia savannae TaxID=1637837 RepID=A0ABR5T6U4_9BURK|nr:hypothetical protein WS78_26725 [Burkholderia savannae]AOK50717.1 hypothetical protein WT60_28530 [Burkholderia sp. MSMB617WGS]KVG44189.1 hypothetical protein WS77_09655 [Burkholderia sp. MSMB0265]KVG87716.1 hypothetical protein WS81_25635 [Burkholderia sp. MSMB2040]KVG96440.1 hypothetical protein WS83_03520 [Burkholderia sp. MSMB2042]KVG97118.1 hypothetical protein WS82_29865 [Burkholderia sp. MSMB2041]